MVTGSFVPILYSCTFKFGTLCKPEELQSQNLFFGCSTLPLKKAKLSLFCLSVFRWSGKKKSSVTDYTCIMQMHSIFYFRSAVYVATITTLSFYLISVSSCYLKNFHPIWEIFWNWDIVTWLWQYRRIVIHIFDGNQYCRISCFENIVLLSCLENRVCSCKFHILITLSYSSLTGRDCVYSMN